MGHSSISIKARRRKVASLAAYSKQYTVKNCTIKIVKNAPIVYTNGNGEWNIPKNGFKQPKSLNKETSIKEPRWVPLGKRGFAAKCKAYEDAKLAKWERKHPRPIKKDDQSPDLFEAQFIPQWEKERDIALERIRDFIVSMFDKLPLTGRYKESENKFIEKPVAELKDVNGEGHRVNELDEKSKLLDKAQKATNKEKAKNAKLVATNLKDHKRKKGRIILPKAA